MTPLTLYKNGNVGINTTTPGSKLHIKQSVDTSAGGIYLESADGWSGAVWREATGDGALILRNNGINTLAIKGGYVGIGDATPPYKFSVEHTAEGTIASFVSLVAGRTQGLYIGTDQDSPYQVTLSSSGTSVGEFAFKTGDTERVRITAAGILKEPNYTSGWMGTNWKIQADGDAEFENMFIRGGLTVYELIINQLHYQNGGLVIGAGAGRIATVVDDTQGSEILTFEDPEGNGIIPFSVGAIVKMQKVDINRTTVVRVIVREVSDADASDYTIEFTETAGWVAADDDVGVFEVGDEVCAIGHTSDTDLDSCIYMSATDVDNPFLRVLDGVDTYAKFTTAGTTLKLQLGNLESAAGHDIVPVDPGYGLYCDNVYLSGVIVANTGYIGGTNGWVIAEGKITSTDIGIATTTGDATYAFWAGDDTPADAEFSVKHTGALKAVGATELGTATQTVDFKDQGMAIIGPDIYENAYEGNSSGININRFGYQGGWDYFRDFTLADGKAHPIMMVVGSTKKTTFYGGLDINPSAGIGGLTVPRMTEAEADAIGAAGMIVYITDLGHFYGYTNAWRILD